MSDVHGTMSDWDAIVDRYLAGVASPDEVQAVRTRLEARPADGVALDIFLHGLAGAEPGDVDASLARLRAVLSISAAMPATASSRTMRPKPRPVANTHAVRRRTAWQIWSVTSAVAVGLVVLAVWLFQLPHQHAVESVATTYVTPRGGRAKIVLSDGTVVTLNVASRIEVPKQFDERHRNVRLFGEADFQVARTVGAPFVVNARGAQVRVLGTEFGVRAYQPGDVQVSVRTGKVALDTTVLGANDVAQVTTLGHVTVARNQNLESAFAFTQGRLVVNSSALRNVVADLDRWYDVDIRFGDTAIGDMPIDAVLMSGSIGDLTEILQHLYDARVVRDGRTLTLYQR